MNTEFSAKLQGIKLNDEAKTRISSGIQEIVLKELARMDNQGDLMVKNLIRLRPTNGIIAVEKAGVISVSALE